MKRLIFFFFLLFMISCTQDPFEVSEDTGQLKSAAIEPLVTDQVIVKYKGRDKIEVIKNVKDVPGLVEKLSKNEKVEYAEPDQIMNHFGFPDDTLFEIGNLWNMYSETSTPANEWGCQAIKAWEKGQTGSNEVWVGIIDQGYWYDHEDLIANAGQNPFEIPGDGIDNEGNGYIDDIYGWDFYNKNNSVFDGSYDYHGTHVAGIIGAAGNNHIGVAGVVWNVKIINVKFLGPYGGFTSDAVLAVNYMVDLKTRGLNLVAVNNSWGGEIKSRALQQAFTDAENAGIIMVCAAGNTGASRMPFPAGYRNANIISVASINMAGNLSMFSTYNKRQVDIAAPGERIWSTYYSFPGSSFYQKYYYLSGTSMAAPHVTGACALYKSLHPDATWEEIKAAILSKAIPTPSLVGKVSTGGRLDVSNF